MAKDKDLVEVTGAEVKKGKKQHLEPGKKYKVTKDIAEALKKNGQAK